ncbi:MAG: hypothetical protein JNL05_13655 [Flavobacteriales bacterium]|nr:hypothetical protein [Flavobacteriales bacterium]
MLRKLRKVLLVSVGVVVLLFGALVGLAYLYEDEVLAALRNELNTHLRTPVQVEGMELTLVQRFPQASLRLRNVMALEVRSDSLPADTLLYAQDLYLEFGLFDLLGGDHTVKQVHGRHVRLYPGLDAQGTGNWLIWKSDSTTTESTAFALNKVSFDDLVVRYRDARSQLEILAATPDVTLSGRFEDAGSTARLRGPVTLVQWTDKGRTVLNDRSGQLALQLSWGGADGAFRITKGEVLTNDVPLNVTLAVTPGKDGDELDLKANGLGLQLADVVALLPEGAVKRLRRYGIDGEADLALHYRGPIATGPSLSAGLKVRDGRMKEQRSGTVFKAINGEFAVDLRPDGTPSKLVVKGFSARAASGTVSGSLDLQGITQARVKLDLRTNIALADLLRFAQVDTLEQVQGALLGEVHATGKLRDVGDIRATDLRALTMTGNARLTDASLKLRGVRHRLTALHAELALKGNDATVRGLKAQVQGQPLELSGTLRNLMPYLLFPDQRLMIEAKLVSPGIDLAALLHEEGGAQGTDYALVLPALIDVDLQADVARLAFEDFRAEAIHTKLRLHDRVLRASPLTFNTAGGAVLAELELDGRNALSYPLSINATVKDMDVSALFKEFQDFGQTFIGHRHLKGTTHAQIALATPLSPALVLDERRLVCVMDLGITRGELIGHQPLMEVADYLKSQKMVAPFVDTDELRRRLAHVTFSDLENQIEIRDRTVHIPAMVVHSSAMDIEVSGSQTFDGGIDHHLNFRLADLFRKGDGQDEFGPVVDDGTGMRVFLHMYGTTADPQFANDGAMAAARRKQKLKEESATLKTILREEFGKAPGERTTGTGTATNQPVFSVDWGTDSTTTQVAPPPKKRKGLGRLLNEEENQPVITIEE